MKHLTSKYCYSDLRALYSGCATAVKRRKADPSLLNVRPIVQLLTYFVPFGASWNVGTAFRLQKALQRVSGIQPDTGCATGDSVAKRPNFRSFIVFAIRQQEHSSLERSLLSPLLLSCQRISHIHLDSGSALRFGMNTLADA